jgi:mRNA degradation ribonuclease J1/J2
VTGQHRGKARLVRDHISEVALLKVQVMDGLSWYLYERTKRRPMVFPVVVEV